MTHLITHKLFKHPLAWGQLLLQVVWLLLLGLTLPLSMTQWVLALLISLLASGISLYALYQWLNAVQRLQPTVAQVQRGNFSSRFPTTHLPELQQLSDTFNALLQQCETLNQDYQQQHDNLAANIEQLALILWEWDLDSETLSFSSQWRNLIGIDSLSLSKQAWLNILHPDDIKPLLNACQLHWQQKTAFFDNIHRLKHQQGYYIWVWLRARTCYRSDGQPFHVTGIYQDITEYKYQENLLLTRLQRNAQQLQSATTETLNVLQASDLNPSQTQWLEIVRSNISLMPYALSNTAAELHHTTCLPTVLTPETTQLNRLLDNSLGLFAVAAVKKRLYLITHIEANVPLNLQVDQARLQYMLVVLLSNALKFTMQGDIILHVSVLETHGAYRTLRFEVQDSGIGMTTEQYQTLQQTLQRPFCGQHADSIVAVGLPAVQHWAGVMGGEFGIHHSLKQGCRAWFSAVFNTAVVHQVHQSANPLAKRRVVIAEDHPRQRQSLIAWLQRWQMHIELADNINNINQKLVDTPTAQPDIILISLTDLHSYPTELLQHLANWNCAIVFLVPLLDSAQPQQTFATFKLPQQLSNPHLLVSKPLSLTCLQNQLALLLNSKLEPAVVTETPVAQETTSLSPVAAVPKTALSAAHTKTAAVTHPLRLLVVEDSPMNREVITDMLQRLHYSADMAENGQQAVNLYEQNKYDLIFMDCEMPVMDGYTATRTIRKLEQAQQLAHTPIIALTAHAMMQHRQLTQEAGMDDHISKPLRLSVLRKVLEQWSVQKNAATSTTTATPSPENVKLSTHEPTTVSDNVTPDMTGADIFKGKVQQDTTEDNAATSAEETQYANLPVLDIKALEVLRSVVGDDISPFCQQFIQYAPQQAMILHDSYAQQDTEGVRRKAHQFKGESLQIGANRLAEVCKNIEFNAQQAQLANIANLLQRLDNEVQNVITALQQVN